MKVTKDQIGNVLSIIAPLISTGVTILGGIMADKAFNKKVDSKVAEKLAEQKNLHHVSNKRRK